MAIGRLASQARAQRLPLVDDGDIRRRANLAALEMLFAASTSRVKAALKRSDERLAYKRRQAAQHTNGSWYLQSRRDGTTTEFLMDRPPTRGTSDQSRGDD